MNSVNIYGVKPGNVMERIRTIEALRVKAIHDLFVCKSDLRRGVTGTKWTKEQLQQFLPESVAWKFVGPRSEVALYEKEQIREIEQREYFWQPVPTVAAAAEVDGAEVVTPEQQ